MKKNTNKATQGFSQNKPSRTSTKTRWHALGLGRQDRPDPAALTFARMGLLASRW